MGTKRLIDAIGELVVTYKNMEIEIERIALPTWMIELIDVEFAIGLNTPSWLSGGFQ